MTQGSANNVASGARLFDLVSEYAALGDHRTGSEVDHATATWVAEHLADRGLTVERQELPFQRHVSTSTLRADGDEIDHLVVPGEWVGSIQTSDVHVESIDPHHGGFPEVLDDHAQHVRATGASAAVFATEHPDGSLVAINREIDSDGSGLPVLLVAGSDHERLIDAEIILDLETTAVPATTTNIIATNQRDGRPLVLTTPLNGWFRAAGERGTGIAVLLDLVEQIDHPLVVVATAGHELGFFGAHRWVDTAQVDACGVVVIGASVAVEETTATGRQLASTRFAMTTIDGAPAERLAVPLGAIDLPLRAGVERFAAGEGKAFSRLGVPTMTCTGMGLDFHTPRDTPQRATSPDALARVSTSLADAIEVFLTAC